MTAFRAFWTLVELLINFIQKEVFFWRVELSTVEEVLAETQSLGHLGCTGGGGLERLAKFGLLLLGEQFYQREDLLNFVGLVLLIKADGSRFVRAKQLLG